MDLARRGGQSAQCEDCHTEEDPTSLVPFVAVHVLDFQIALASRDEKKILKNEDMAEWKPQ